MLIINIIALICSLFFLCIPLVPVFLHTCTPVSRSCTLRKLWTFRFDLYCNTLCQFRPPG